MNDDDARRAKLDRMERDILKYAGLLLALAGLALLGGALGGAATWRSYAGFACLVLGLVSLAAWRLAARRP